MLLHQKYSPVIHEEKRTVKWFLALFYIISILFDFFYFYISPEFISHSRKESPDSTRYAFYVFLFLLLPIAYYFNKKKKHQQIKYIYFISYTVATTVMDVSSFISNPGEYQSGNAVEILWLLMSPIFVNKRFFWVVSLGLIFRYCIVGIVIKSPIVFFPILMIVVLSIFAFILLVRFQCYIEAIKSSYDQQLEGMVKGIIATLELKDPYTRGHSERVAHYSLDLAKINGTFTDEELKAFTYACLLHDIGKINIPDSILMKPGKLTSEEFDIIQSHPAVGAEAVKHVEGLNESISVIRSHHERWDGKGYPDKLHGNNIPLMARIVSVADAFDAMTSSRSYRPAMSVEDAYKRITEGTGSQFDPDQVELFKKIFPIWVRYHENYPWTVKR